MGYGSYSASDWSKLKASRNLRSTQSETEVFKRREINPKFDPRFIGTRECFDSDDHPHTTPIVVGLDVTASMGYLAVNIATGALNDLIVKLYSTGAIEDPSLMCAAYGDYQDSAPLQVTQFESDIRISEQLLDLYFENGGQNQVVPSCLWEFLSEHTNIDAIKKRGEKGFIFTIGDGAEIRENDVASTIERVIGDRHVSYSLKTALSEVQKKFHVFHIMVGAYKSKTNKDLMKGHLIQIGRGDIDSLPEIMISTIQLQKGMPLDTVIAQWDKIKHPVVRAAISQLTLVHDGDSVTL